VRRVDLPPPAPAQAQETRPDPQSNAPSVAIVRKVPLGAEQPVALVNPPQDRSAEQREARELREARKKARETQQLEKKRKLEQRKLVEQRRQQSIKEAEELKAATRSRQVEVDDKDERQERPAFFRREREEPFGRPFFRLFSDED